MNEIFSMTNSTRLIELDKKKYILRVPGKGTESSSIGIKSMKSTKK